MEYLKVIRRIKNASVYELKGEYGDSLQRYVVSTPETRAICNRPEITGVRFTELLERALTFVLKSFPPARTIRKLDPLSIGVVHFLRGSLNFGLRRSLARAYGFNTQCSSFITSQRAKDKYGRWYITENQYRKIVIPFNATLFLADVIATGVTISNGLDTIVNLAKNSGTTIRKIYFFTIGCHKLEKILKQYDSLLRQHFPHYEGSCAVYLEGKFHLADSKTKVKIKIQGTDLMRSPSILTPEFELSQYDSINYPLERCVVYDAGTRACDIREYLRNLEAYWESLRFLAERGWTLEEALRERWPEEEYRLPFKKFQSIKAKQWRGVEQEFLRKLYMAYHKRWSKAFTTKAKTSKALLDVCNRRLKTLSKAL
jgi:hypothetical protein